MLILTRKSGQSIRVGDITVHVLDIRRSGARIGVTAPADMPITRTEHPTSHRAGTPDADAAQPATTNGAP